MTTLVLADVGNLQDTVTAANVINSNSDLIETAVGTCLNKQGDQLLGTLDANSKHIINLPSPLSAFEPLRLQDLSTFNGGGTISSIPAGGSTNQVLTKTSNTDFAVAWETVSPVNIPNTWTALQTYNNNDFALLGSSTGTTVVNSANSTASNFTVTVPAITDTLVTLTATQNLTNKTLTNPAFTTIINTGTLTLPTSSDTLIGRNTTDTLTNKTLTSPTLTGTVAGANTIPYSILSQSAANSLLGNFTTSTANVTASTIGALTLKATPGSTDQVLISDQAASGALKYTTVSALSSSSGVASLNTLTGTINTSVVVQTFAIPGTSTYTPTPGMLHCVIECVGGGGGGGGVNGTAGLFLQGGGGGSGGYSRKYSTYSAANGLTITVGSGGSGGSFGNGGTGGSSSVGSICVASGGFGGFACSTGAVGFQGAGAGTGTGDITAAGSPGQGGQYETTLAGSIYCMMGNGGSSVFGGGAVGSTFGTGANASHYGGGGAGASANQVASNFVGGNGSAGVVIITEYVNL